MVAFISHAKEDDVFITKLRTELHLRGHVTWVDHFDIPSAVLWAYAIDQALSQSKVMILALSENAIKSDMVKMEWGGYLSARKPIIPIKVRPCVIPILLHSIQFIDFTKEEDFMGGLEMLMKVLPPPSDDDFINITPPVKRETKLVEERKIQTVTLRERSAGLVPDTGKIGEAHLVLPEHNKVIGFSLSQPIMIGRDDGTHQTPMIDLRPFGADEAGVSRKHLLVANTSDGVTVTDLKSSNGTFISGRRLPPNRPVVIRSNSLIRLGNFAVEIHYQR